MEDSAFIGRRADKVGVKIVRTGTPQAIVAVFGVHGSAIQDDACSPDARLRLEDLDYDVTEEIGELEGFARSVSCKGLNLGDVDGCDSLHMYWNHKANAPTWWRL
jgi:hypothetical protein